MKTPFLPHSLTLSCILLLGGCVSDGDDSEYRTYEPDNGNGGEQNQERSDCLLQHSNTGLTLKVCDLPADTTLTILHTSAENTSSHPLNGNQTRTSSLNLPSTAIGDSLKIGKIEVAPQQGYLVTCRFQNSSGIAQRQPDGSLILQAQAQGETETVRCGRAYLLGQPREQTKTGPYSYQPGPSGFLLINIDTARASWLNDSSGQPIYETSRVSGRDVINSFAGGKAILAGKQSDGTVGLWSTDGTITGAQKLASLGTTDQDIHFYGGYRDKHKQPLPELQSGDAFTSGNPEVLSLSATTKASPLWYRTDGTTAGTVAEKWDTTTYPADAVVRHAVTFNGKRYATVVLNPDKPTRHISTIAIDINTGAQETLATSDDFESATNPATGDVSTGGLFAAMPSTTEAVNGQFILMGGTDYRLVTHDNGAESVVGYTGVWSSDGSKAGTRKIYEPSTSTAPTLYTPWKEKLYFIGDDTELWETDGTPTGTKKVVKVTNDRITDIVNMAASNDALYLQVRTREADSSIGMALLKSDGTAAGTHIVELPDGLAVGGARGLYPSGMFVLANRVVFYDDGQNYRQLTNHLWSTDGTKEGTFRLFPTAESSPIHPKSECQLRCSLTQSYRLGDRVVLRGQTKLPVDGGDEDFVSYWVTDGTLEGTVRLLDEATGERFQHQSAQ
ncbi:hypothetical protein [Kerstersia similis]|uniref:hypothetical protein n=1 Tax=Kerstersia similis TaxID=206505 RepID=UPI0039F14B0A